MTRIINHDLLQSTDFIGIPDAIFFDVKERKDGYITFSCGSRATLEKIDGLWNVSIEGKIEVSVFSDEKQAVFAAGILCGAFFED